MAKKKEWPQGLEAFVTTDEGYRITTSFVAGKRNRTYFKVESPDGRLIRMGSFPSSIPEPSFSDLDRAWTMSEGDMRQDITRRRNAGERIPPSRNEAPVKRYAIYLNDNPYDPMYCDAKNKTEARKAGQLYIRQWALHTTINRIEEA